MTDTQSTERLTDSIEAAKYALRELLLAKEVLKLTAEPVRGFRIASRRFRRVNRAIERQTLSLVSDLTSMGVATEVIGALIRSAQSEALSRRGSVAK